MKKKYLVYGVGVVMAFSLVACGSQTQEPDQPVVQQSEPTAQPIEIKAEEPAEQKTEPTVLEGEQLTVYFQKAYDIINTVREDSSEEQINREIAYVAKSVTSDNLTKDVSIKLPDDYKDQYIAWRKTQAFTTCEETVYATGEVNIRASWSAESEELGTLSWGDSLTRIGKGIEGTDAESWSMVQLEDGLTAYVSSNYLSTSKPTQKSSNSGGSAGKSGGGRIIEEDGSTTASYTDPSHHITQEELKEGIDPNRDPWDTVYRPVYGGAGGGSTNSTTPSDSADSDSSQSNEMVTSTTPPNVIRSDNAGVSASNGKSADPNFDPWDTEYKAVYGGSGG